MKGYISLYSISDIWYFWALHVVTQEFGLGGYVVKQTDYFHFNWRVAPLSMSY